MAKSTNPKAYAAKLKRLLQDCPEGWGIYCMDGGMLLVPPETQARLWSGEYSDLTQAPHEERRGFLDAGKINDSGGW